MFIFAKMRSSKCVKAEKNNSNDLIVQNATVFSRAEPKYYAIFSWSEYFFFLKEPVFARGVQCLKTYWLCKKHQNFQGRRNRGQAGGQLGNCFFPHGFGTSVNPISIRVGGRLCPPNYY